MQTIGVLEAKTHLADLLDRVEHGESVTITRDGKAVARLVPVSPAQQHDRLEAIRELRGFGRGHRLDGLSIRDLINRDLQFEVLDRDKNPCSR